MSDIVKLRKAVAIHTCLSCQDIPEVQTVIRMLSPLLLGQYDDNVEEVLDGALIDVEDILAEDNLDDDDYDFFIQAMWLSFLPAFAKIDMEIDRTAAVGGRRLASSGAAKTLAPLPRSSREIAEPSADDLRFWFRRVASTDPSIERDVKGLVRRFVKDPGQHHTAGKLSLIQNMREVFKRARRSVVMALDTWAYRWHSIGAFEGLIAKFGNEVKIVAVNNPPTGPDDKTTPFCRWVHGQVVEVRKIRRQIQGYLSAVSDRNVDRAKEMWPLLSSKDASSEGTPFAESFKRLGMPPYHPFCRTVMRRK